MAGIVGESGPEHVLLAGQKVTPGYAGYQVFPGQVVGFAAAVALTAIVQTITIIDLIRVFL